MYRSITREQYLERLEFPPDYKVDGVLVYGTLYEERTLAQLLPVLASMGYKVEALSMSDPFLRFARELRIGDKTIWFVIAYGGSWLSEYLHWACLFGSKKNILLGSCGGLKKGIEPGDFLVPTFSYAQESSAMMYDRESANHYPDTKLTTKLVEKLEKTEKIWKGPLITCQAMIGETWEDIVEWSKAGYYGIEMEAATTFAVSKHFNVPAAASVYMGDNLIEKQTNFSADYAKQEHIREQKREAQMRAALELLLED